MQTSHRGTKDRIRRLIEGPRKPTPQLVSVPIDRCRHYNGYKYGSSAFNPYENYIVGMHCGLDREGLRDRFEDYLRYFRPRDFGDLLQVLLSNPVPMWVYPWDSGATIRANGGWLDDVDSVPDIITHFSKQGIPRSKIDEEYFWLERAYNTIATMGYQPRRFSYITVFELRDDDGSVFIVKDGNHRLSSLAALGHTHALVAYDDNEVVDVSRRAGWPHVVSGLYSATDAQTLFRAYFDGVDDFPRAIASATIIE